MFRCLAMAAAIAIVISTVSAEKVFAQQKNARVHFYLFCNDRDDNTFEQTDEVYLAGLFRSSNGKHNGAIARGPNDFRDGGPSERWRDYNDIAKGDLGPGETLSGKIIVLEDDKSIANDVLGALPKALDAGLKDDKSTEATLAKVLATALSFGAKGSDDQLGIFNFTVTNENGTLKLAASSEGPEINDEGTTERTAEDGSKITLRVFRILHGCNYHVALWCGSPQPAVR